MKGILSEELFHHYALLVGGIYLLSKESISQADLTKARMLLTHFVEMLDVYYGKVWFLDAIKCSLTELTVRSTGFVGKKVFCGLSSFLSTQKQTSYAMYVGYDCCCCFV